MSTQNLFQQKIVGINHIDALIRFESKLKQRYVLQDLDKTHDSIVFRKRFCLICEPEIPVQLQIYSTENMMITGSPKIPESEFKKEVQEIFVMAKESIKTESSSDTPLSLRANLLFDYLIKIDIREEVSQVVIVTIGDLIIDILLSDKINELDIKGREKRELMEQYLPIKIKALKGKGVAVYRDSDINRLHNLRNRIVHSSTLISEKEAEWAIDLLKDLIEHH
jgi:hypothetical protein